MPVTEDEEYETTDIYLAAYFAIAGCDFVRKREERIHNSDRKRVYFVFTNKAGSIKELRDAYHSGQGRFSEYAQKIKDYKQMCF